MICGGAALTRKYVEDDLRAEYSNAVFYADDAFDGLHVMEDLAAEKGPKSHASQKVARASSSQRRLLRLRAIAEAEALPMLDGTQRGGRSGDEYSRSRRSVACA